MGFIQNVKKIFSKKTETSEKHEDKTLQTHYYKAMREKVFAELETMFSKKQGFEVSSISEEHGEMIVHVKSGKKAFMVITIIMVRPYRTAVDFSVHTDTVLFSDFGYSAKLIRSLYKELNERLTFTGTGLGDELSR
ncbi:DUF1499 domain-containing protein [Alkalicoccus saliphilus]|jgi:hypothetical protein|uniref:DUF1499 domain-containing protein n=1 Tax=Alkalicoccus saliphilus TaxID=200989 RepID=A0A2T4U8Y6_9BACI|nr:DUF1499 domain-containing protein [Alkalicoccus saliphilus]PTL39872.1 DUF1499 domain-containing protein [Alkalicoccus saliphilus]